MSESRLSPERRIEQYFQTALPSDCMRMADRVRVIADTRAISEKWSVQPTKLGRPPKRKTAPPIASEAVL
jgi:hypothetical protein